MLAVAFLDVVLQRSPILLSLYTIPVEGTYSGWKYLFAQKFIYLDIFQNN